MCSAFCCTGQGRPCLALPGPALPCLACPEGRPDSILYTDVSNIARIQVFNQHVPAQSHLTYLPPHPCQITRHSVLTHTAWHACCCAGPINETMRLYCESVCDIYQPECCTRVPTCSTRYMRSSSPVLLVLNTKLLLLKSRCGLAFCGPGCCCSCCCCGA